MKILPVAHHPRLEPDPDTAYARPIGREKRNAERTGKPETPISPDRLPAAAQLGGPQGRVQAGICRTVPFARRKPSVLLRQCRQESVLLPRPLAYNNEMPVKVFTNLLI